MNDDDIKPIETVADFELYEGVHFKITTKELEEWKKTRFKQKVLIKSNTKP